ncbi:hypothetical protein Dsin_023513 [Dipteronia sinensis]|uniref:Activator of Hsp90 ATPase homologue 1/2-like C-terminal domain-containing protein n=1 Tax=Dipteronia sinensis TaxID=43782 RepID=A0AAE0A3F2_9ROSI|nr:hypothetical protein Dsin_023513 [Dipteronia sinensis]
MLSNGKPLILERVRTFVQSMAKGGPCKDELEAKKVAPKTNNISSANSSAVNEVKKDTVTVSKKKKKEGWKGFTQSNAKISKEVGGEFSIFDGSVTGKNLELEDGKLIVQKWRFGSWPDGIDSTVRLTFDEPEPGVTVVKLIHTDIPEEDRNGNATVVENTERGWRDLILHKIRAVIVSF